MQANKRYRYKGKEVCVFPIDMMKCSQTAGLDANGNLVQTLSHNGTYAYDFVGYDNEKRTIYAPVSVVCTLIETTPAERGNRAWFVSTEPVKTPIGDEYIYFYLIHSEDVSNLVVGQEYKQGTPIYTMGRSGIATGIHVHIEAKTGNNHPGGSTNSEGVWHMNGNEPLQKLFFSNETDIVNGNIGTGTFIEFDFGKFTPYENGWNYHKSETYYVENMQMVTGWKKVDNCWYFLNPKSGDDNHKTDYEEGEMLTGWVWLDDHWYLFGEGGIMQTGWVWNAGYTSWYYFYTSGAEAGQMATKTWIDDIYYALESGKMAKNCQICENNKYYAFNNSGECLNTSGQSTQYDTTTYPLMS